METWNWLQGNLEPLITHLTPERSGWLMWIPISLCSVEAAQESEKTFAPWVEKIVGGPRNLRASTEALRVCAAVKASQAMSARAFFDAAATKGAQRPSRSRAPSRSPAPR